MVLHFMVVFDIDVQFSFTLSLQYHPLSFSDTYHDASSPYETWTTAKRRSHCVFILPPLPIKSVDLSLRL